MIENENVFEIDLMPEGAEGLRVTNAEEDRAWSHHEERARRCRRARVLSGETIYNTNQWVLVTWKMPPWLKMTPATNTV